MGKTGLVLEGGAARGIYTAGVLDVLLENGILADGLIGVSAGAVHGCSYVSGQSGRSYWYSTQYCADKRYMSFWSLLHTGDLCGAQFCYYDLPRRLVPFNSAAFDRSQTAYYVVCTDIVTGQPVYKRCETVSGNAVEWMRASASMPLVSRTVEIDGRLLLDGGITDSIPFRAFQRMGYDRCIVVRTQPDGYRKKPEKTQPLIALRYRKYPALVRAMRERHTMYNRQLDDLAAAAAAGEVFVIRPSRPMEIGRIEKDKERVRAVYLLGRQDALAQLPALRRFAGSR